MRRTNYYSFVVGRKIMLCEARWLSPSSLRVYNFLASMTIPEMDMDYQEMMY
jgi:hypothetical protein